MKCKMAKAENMRSMDDSKITGMSRRGFLIATLIGGISGLLGVSLIRYIKQMRAEVFIARVANYTDDIKSVILSGMKESGCKTF